MKPLLVAIFVTAIILLSLGCSRSIPKDALSLQPESLQNRQMQTRKFATADEISMLNASTGVLQDIGFTMEEASGPLGVLVGSKNRSAINGVQVTMAMLAAFGGAQVPIDSEQRMRASVVTRMLPNHKEMSVRVTFQRIVYNNRGQVTTCEDINDPEVYQEFFSKLSKSVFLVANQI